MDNWPGRETADITYDDRSGVLTAILIARGYLVEQVWRDARPKYFMEVKTTTGECGDRLYISSNQYQLVCRNQVTPVQKLNNARCNATRSHQVDQFRMFTLSSECSTSVATI